MDAPPPPLPPVEAVRIGGSVRCIHCRYALVGLAEDGACPECGEPILHTLRGVLALYASDTALASLHRGSAVVLVSALPPMPIAIAMLATVEIVPKWLSLTLVWACVLAVGAYLFGWWLMSAPMSARAQHSEGDRLRSWIRGMLFVHAIILGCFGVATFLPDLFWGTPSGATIWAIIGGALLYFAAWIATLVVQMLYLAMLANRVPDARLHDRAKLLVWLGPLLVVLGMVIVLPIALVAFVMCWMLVNRFRIAFKRIRMERMLGANAANPETV